MALVTTQQLQDYYDHYRDSEITFTKDITRILNVDPRQVYVKCNGNQWPCIINSTSLMACRIIVGVKGGAYAMLSRKDVPNVSVRFCFINSEKQPVSFMVNGRVHEITAYMNSAELAVITINFTQRPSDELIERIGTLLDANTNAVRRKEERIILNPDVKRKLGLTKEETIVSVQGVPRHCIMRDLSFGGAKIIMMGISKFVEKQQAVLQMRFDDPAEVIQVGGVIISTSPVEGRKDIIIASIKFGDKTVPVSYKIRINNYLVNLRKHALAPEQTTEQKLAAAKAVQEKIVAEERAKMEAEEKAKAEAAKENADASHAENADTSPESPEESKSSVPGPETTTETESEKTADDEAPDQSAVPADETKATQ